MVSLATVALVTVAFLRGIVVPPPGRQPSVGLAVEWAFYLLVYGGIPCGVVAIPLGSFLLRLRVGYPLLLRIAHACMVMAISAWVAVLIGFQLVRLRSDVVDVGTLILGWPMVFSALVLGTVPHERDELPIPRP